MFENIKSSLALNATNKDAGGPETPLKRNIQDVSARLTRYINRVREIEAQQATALQEKTQLEARVKDLERKHHLQLSELQDRCDHTTREHTEMEVSFEKIKSEHKIVSELLSHEQSKSKELYKQLNEVSQSYQELKAKHSPLTNQIKDHEIVKKNLEEKINLLEVTLESLITKHDQAQRRVSELEQNTQDLSELISKKDAIIKQNEKSFENLASAHQSEIKELSDKFNQDLKSAINDASNRFNVELEKYKASSAFEHAEVIKRIKDETHKEFVQTLSRHNAQLESIKSKNDALEANDKESKSLINELEHSLALAKELYNDQAAKFLELAAKNNDYMSTMTTLKRKNQALQAYRDEDSKAKLEEAQALIDRLRAELEAAMAKYTRSVSEADELREEIAAQAQLLGLEEGRLGLNGPPDDQSSSIRLTPHPSGTKKTRHAKGGSRSEDINTSQHFEHTPKRTKRSLESAATTPHTSTSGTLDAETNNAASSDKAPNPPQHKLVDNIAGDVSIKEIEATGGYVKLENTKSQPISLAGWALTDGFGNRFYFPDNYAIGAGQTVTVFTATCDEEFRKSLAVPSDFFWDERPSWSTNGGSIYLINSREEDVSRAIFDDIYGETHNNSFNVNNTSRCKTQ